MEREEERRRGFGAYLRQQRELRGISLLFVAEKTKISHDRLSALEEGRWDRFPARIYLLGAIRSYASALGMNGDDLVLRLYELFPEFQEKEPTFFSREGKRKKRVFLLLFFFFLFILLFLFLSR